MLDTRELIELLDACMLVCKEDPYCSSVVCALSNLLTVTSHHAGNLTNVLKSVNKFWGEGECLNKESLWHIFENLTLVVHTMDRDMSKYPSVHETCFEFSSRLWNIYNELRDYLFPESHPLRGVLLEYNSLVKSINTVIDYHGELPKLAEVITDLEKIKTRLHMVLSQSLVSKEEGEVSLT